MTAPACFEAGDGGGVVGWNVVLQDFGATGGGGALGAEDVLDGDGHAGERRERFAGGDERVDFVGLRVGAFGREREVGVQFGIARVDAFVEFGGEFARGDLSSPQGRI